MSKYAEYLPSLRSKPKKANVIKQPICELALQLRATVLGLLYQYFSSDSEWQYLGSESRL